MMNPTEADEKSYLEYVKGQLRAALAQLDADVRRRAKEIKDQKAYLWDNKAGMDHVEKISVRQSVDMLVLTGEAVLAKKKRIQKLCESPYFGRCDFQGKDAAPVLPIYIGTHAFFNEEHNQCLIHDWRAPIATMFYDFETGPAYFQAPTGRISGDIVCKRQYRIRNGKMEFMLESAVNILDEVLQKELSCASDDRMKTIVATIQRDQNAIIRNEASQVLIIQGVAGSGKTSIALHRIAFLLYRFKDTISSRDILIISPNKVFADYIANVLPELGEEKIPEMGMDKLARTLLAYKVEFQTFFEQVTLLLDKPDPAFKRRIQAKASVAFLNKLKAYVAYIETNYFVAAEFTVSGRLIPAWFMDERFKLYASMPIFKRCDKIAKDIEHSVRIYYNLAITPKTRAEIKLAVKKMFKLSTLRGLYKDFYTWLGSPELLKLAPKASYEYADVFPLIYLKICVEGATPYDHVKHLLIDEMQDYTPVQYAVLLELFSCKKTILGDINQSVNPLSSSSAMDIQEIFTGVDCVKLCKSYRSTCEITDFVQQISPNTELEVVERHGAEPVVMCLKDKQAELQEILRLIHKFAESGQHSLGIICKTQKQAEALFEYINSQVRKSYLLTAHSDVFRQGIVVCTAHMAKGLEFDQVIVPQAGSDNYASEIDKNMLYVACSRAMHQLVILFTGRRTPFLQFLS